MRRALTFYKSNLLPGLLVVGPIAAIMWLGIILIRMLFVNIPALLPSWAQPVDIFEVSNWPAITAINFSVTILIIALFITGVAISGWGSKKYLGRKILSWVDDTIEHIPVLRTVYGALVNMTQTFSKNSQQNFSGVRLISYPHPGIKTLAFVTGSMDIGGVRHLTVFVPTTPNPTSGFFLLVPEKDTFESPYNVQEAFKAILSMGMVRK